MIIVLWRHQCLTVGQVFIKNKLIFKATYSYSSNIYIYINLLSPVWLAIKYTLTVIRVIWYNHPCSWGTGTPLCVPCRYFLWRLVSVVLIQDAWHDAYAWPLLVFLVSCCIYPLASSCAHTFSTMSTSARHICFFFDYGAISFYSLGEPIFLFDARFRR